MPLGDPLPTSIQDPPLAEPVRTGIADIRDRLRSGQRPIADWQGGELAVSAVPGAGKSTGMAGAAAITIARHRLNLRRQLVLVTFTRSAATNLKVRIRRLLRDLNVPVNGFSVHTLHGLALSIANRHPELSGLSLEDSALITPARNHRMIRTCVDQWIAESPQQYQRLIEGQSFDGEETERLRRRAVLRTEVLPDLANTVIHEAKSSGILPQDLRSLAQTAQFRQATPNTTPTQAPSGSPTYNVLDIAAGLYERYQTLLKRRNLIDYDDMILAALRVLQDPETCALWQQQTFAVFEDEAQDSTPLQSQLLEILGRDPDQPDAPPNLVRVGDPNQAINSTFTPADPIFFREFCDRCQTKNRLVTMDRAGRSSPVILDAANFVLDWVNQSDRHQPFRPQHIQPVPQGDPQPNANPAPLGAGLELNFPDTTFETVDRIRARAIALFGQDPQTQAAILVRENKQGRFLAQRLADLEKDHGIVIYEVGQRDRRSNVPSEILTLLQFIQRPHSPDNLKAALTTLMRRQLIPSQDLNTLATAPEQFLYPGPLDPAQTRPVRTARRYCTGLIQARLALPPLQLLSFLALTLNYDPAELASADKLAEQAGHRASSGDSGEVSLATIIAALSEIVGSEKFEGVDLENAESRYTKPGQITIITMHKAKGLDWDVVFLPFLQANTIPGQTWVPPQSKFLGNFTLAEVARAQIRVHLHQKTNQLPNLDRAWEEASLLKQAEEYRLLYVAMTRTKRLLWMSAAQQAPFTWNKPEGIDPKAPCPAITALAQRFPGSVR